MADPRIYAEFARANVPFATLGEIAAQKQQVENGRLNQEIARANLQMHQQELSDKEAESQAKAQREQLIRDAYQRHSAGGKLDQEGLLSELQASGDREAADSVAKSLYAQQAAKIAQEKAARDADQAEADYVSAQTRDMTPETYGQVRQQIITKHPKVASILPEQYDPQAIQHIQTAAMTNAEWLANVNRLEAEAKDHYGKALVNIALADTPEHIQEAFAMADGVASMGRLKAAGITPESVAQMTPEQRRQLLLRVPGITPTALYNALKPAAEQGAQGSDYGRYEADFIAAEAEKRGKSPDQLSPSERVTIKTAARKAYGQADDAARRPLAPIVIQTGAGPQLVDRSTGTARGITDASGQTVGQAPTADMRNKQAGRALVGKSISAIKDIGDKIITRVGPAQRADALKRGVGAVFGNDPEFKVYQDARMALAGNLAVGQQGSRPSDADIKAIWLPLVPDAYTDTKASADMKWKLIRTMSSLDTPDGAAGASATPAPTRRYNPLTGKVEPIK